MILLSCKLIAIFAILVIDFYCENRNITPITAEDATADTGTDPAGRQIAGHEERMNETDPALFGLRQLP